MTPMSAEVRRLIEQLDLRPHPEGGYFRETYRSASKVHTPHAIRDALTTIYYLLWHESFSAFHRIAADEIWHHYRGAPVAIQIIATDGSHRQTVIGEADCWQASVPAGCWFAAHVREPHSYALVGCDVAPGFEFADLEIASRARLISEFPKHRSLIERWTRQ